MKHLPSANALRLFQNLFFTVSLLFTFTLLGCAQTNSTQKQNLTAAEAKELLEKNKEVVILDVRTPEEFANGHLAGARNIDFNAPGFEQEVEKLDKSNTYLLYCASGNRSSKATALMGNKNFEKVNNSTAGYKELKSEGLPTQ